MSPPRLADPDRQPEEARTRDEKRVIWYLRKIPFFEGLDGDPLQRLLGTIELKEIPRRQVIYLPGDLAESVYVIVGGRVKTSKVTRDGKELTLAYRGAGQLFGELCVVDPGPRNDMAEAMKNVIILEFPRELFKALLLGDPTLCFRFAQILGERRQQVESKMEHLVFRDVQAKLAALVVELAEEYGSETDVGIQLGIKITHQEMANLIGSTRETISLTLAHFRKQGLLELDGRTIIVQDLDGLRANI